MCHFASKGKRLSAVKVSVGVSVDLKLDAQPDCSSPFLCEFTMVLLCYQPLVQFNLLFPHPD